MLKMRRLLAIAAALLVLAAVPAWAANNPQNAFDYMLKLSQDPGAFSQGKATSSAKAFFQYVASQPPAGEPVFEKLRALRKNNKAQWGKVSGVENQLMATVRGVVTGVRNQVIGSGGSLGSVYGYADSGKWSIKPVKDLTFDGDFDWTLFALDKNDANPNSGLIKRCNDLFQSKLGVSAASLDVIVNGLGYEKEAGVYISTGGRKWALKEMKNFQSMDVVGSGGKPVTINVDNLKIINPVTGKPFSSPGESIFVYTQLRALRKSNPALFNKDGTIKASLTPEKIAKYLRKAYGAESDFAKIYTSGRYTVHDSTVAPVDMVCHIHEAHGASSPTEQVQKATKFIARSGDIFVQGMANEQWKQFFNGSDIGFIYDTRKAEALKTQRIQAEQERVLFLQKVGQANGTVDTSKLSASENQRLKALDRKVAKAQAKFDAVWKRMVGDNPNGDTANAFTNRVVRVMKKMAEVGFRTRVLEICSYKGRGAPARRQEAFKQLQKELKLMVEHYSKDGKAPPEVLKWASDAEKALNVYIQTNAENPGGLARLKQGLIKIGKLFKKDLQVRQRVQKMLTQTELGRSLLKHVPEWALEATPPKVVTATDFMTSADFMKSLVARPYAMVKTSADVLIYLDMFLQMTDVWATDAPVYEKLWVTAKMVILPMLLGKSNALVIPAVYAASLTGNPNQIAYAITIYICPVAMIPMVIENLGNRYISYVKVAMFEKELEAMFKASLFTPEPGKEPDDWVDDPSLVRYQWEQMVGYSDTYTRDGMFDPPRMQTPNMAEYVRRMAEKDPQEKALISQYQTGMDDIAAAKTKLVLEPGVPLAFRALVVDGDQKLFRSNQALSAACKTLREFNCQSLAPFMTETPKYCPKGWADKGFAIPVVGWDRVNQGIKFDLLNNRLADGEEAKLARGQLQAIKKLLEERAKLQKKVYDLLADSIIRSFEQEMKARYLAKLGVFKQYKERLENLGEQLGIKDKLMANFQEALDKVKETGEKGDVERMKIADNWVTAYEQIVQTRNQLVAFCSNIGVPNAGLSHMLYGYPPLKGKPDWDGPMTAATNQEIMGVPDDIKTMLFYLKGKSIKDDPADPEVAAVLARYLMMGRILELWLGGPDGALPGWWEPVETDVDPKAWAEKRRDYVVGRVKGDQLDFINEDAAALGRAKQMYWLAARGFADKINRAKVFYLGRLKIEPAPPLDLAPEQDVELTVTPLHPDAKLAVKPVKVDGKLLTVAPDAAIATADASVKFKVKRLAEGDETPPPKTVFGLKSTPEVPDILKSYASGAEPTEIEVILSGGKPVVVYELHGKPAAEGAQSTLLEKGRVKIGGRP